MLQNDLLIRVREFKLQGLDKRLSACEASNQSDFTVSCYSKKKKTGKFMLSIYGNGWCNDELRLRGPETLSLFVPTVPTLPEALMRY